MAAVSALNELDDKRITHIKPLIPPQILMEDLPLSLKAVETILDGRQGAEDIIHGRDDRLLVVVGPCSIHDVEAGLEYGKLVDKKKKKRDEQVH
jgi:3-deoxy-7-phosphoheptulonate synthase